MRSLRFGVLLVLSVAAACDDTSHFCDAVPCSDPARPYCNLETRRCEAAPIPCGDGGCVDAAQPAADASLSCQSHADCTEPRAPECENGTCQPCGASTGDAACQAHDPATPLCRFSGPNAGRCVACRFDADCTQPDLHVCDVTGYCRGCTSHRECTSGICHIYGEQAGTCVSESEIDYVDINDPNCNNDVQVVAAKRCLFAKFSRLCPRKSPPETFGTVRAGAHDT